MDIDALDGAAFLELAREQEEHCARSTATGLPQLGVRAPACLEEFGKALNTLSGAASCRWGCSSSDHLTEYLLGRAESTGHAGYRLMMHGFYDESLALSRSLGELANLLLLFNHEPAAYATWKGASRSERLAAFSPARVRQRLEKSPFPAGIGVDRERYAALCEIGVHATPKTRPNAHSPDGIPRLGAYFQPLGALIALNELAFSLGIVMAGGGPLVATPGVHKRLKGSAVALIKSIGGITILNAANALDGLRQATEGEGPDTDAT